MNQHTDALKYLQRALQIEERATTNAETDRSLTTTLHELGRCLLGINQHTNALKYFQRALQIKERATTNAETDRSLATTLYELVDVCSVLINKLMLSSIFTERYKYLNEQQQMLNLAIASYNVSCCLFDLNKPEIVLAFFEKCLETEKRSAVDSATNKNVLLTV